MGESNAERERSLDASIKDGVAYSFMVGLGEQYIPPYAIRLGAVNIHMAVLTAVPNFIGSIFQMVSAAVVDRTRRRKIVTMTGAMVQGFAWLPILLTLLLPYPANLWLLIAVFVLYCSAIQFSTPAWNSMMGDLVPAERRGRYFGRRNMMIFSGICIAALIGGTILHVAEDYELVWETFALLFALSFFFRMISCGYLSRMVDPPYAAPPPEEHFTIVDFVRRMPSSNFGRFVLYIMLIHASVHLAGPFFALYMLRDLHMSYLDFTIAQIAHAIPMFAAMPFWGWCGDRYGSKKILQMTGMGIALIPFLWLAGTSTVYIWAIQLYAGFIWAGFTLCMTNFIFDSVTPAKRARCFAYFNFLNGIGMLAGGMIGGLLATEASDLFAWMGLPFLWASEILFIIALSGILRAVVHLTLIGSFREVREVVPLSGRGLFANMENIALLARKAFEMFFRRDR